MPDGNEVLRHGVSGIINPVDSVDTSGGSTKNFNQFLDGTEVSSDIFQNMISGIWWWCIIYNNITKTNVDIVYTTPTIYFEYENFRDGLIEYTQEYFDTNVPTVTLLKLPETLKVIELTNPKLSNNDFLANTRALVNGTFSTEEIPITTPEPTIYSIASFRRLLNPVDEYLQYKSSIDTIQFQDIQNDLLFSFVLFEKTKYNTATLNQRIADIDLQLDQLLQIKQRLQGLPPDEDTIASLFKLNQKIAELEASRQKLLELKEKYDAFLK